jgi:hypothetical protein
MTSAPRMLVAVAMLENSATPTAVPSCVDVFSRPEIAPRQRSATAAVPSPVDATAATPRLTPDSARAAPSRPTPCIRARSSSAAATPARPIAITACGLRRRPSDGLAADPQITARLNGRNASPVSIAPRCSVRWA